MKRVALIKDRTEFYNIYNELLQGYNIKVEVLNFWNPQDHDYLLEENWDGFIWRAKHDPKLKNQAKRMIYFFNNIRNVNTYPFYEDYWHYDSKLNQYYIFREKGIPTPYTRVFYTLESALRFIKDADMPLISKSSSGAGSRNVQIFKNRGRLKRYIKKIFKKGVKTAFKNVYQKNYVYLQSFISDCVGDYRVVFWGNNLATGFFRRNRENSPFASGSGKREQSFLNSEVLDFAYDIHRKLSNSVMSYDIIKDSEGKLYVLEMSILFGDLNGPYDEKLNYFKRTSSHNWEIIEGSKQDYYYRHRKLIELILNKWGWIE